MAQNLKFHLFFEGFQDGIGLFQVFLVDE